MQRESCTRASSTRFCALQCHSLTPLHWAGLSTGGWITLLRVNLREYEATLSWLDPRWPKQNQIDKWERPAPALLVKGPRNNG